LFAALRSNQLSYLSMGPDTKPCICSGQHSFCWVWREMDLNHRPQGCPCILIAG